ncbi:MAG: PIG-L family deacetylase [Methylacidiphilales bacterium]|nr:PIG-L family deacetylase [Candidatus Methylacidiphilales bacterium]MDW8349548.1 PIG-L family deacetylase [Verrucomicrobiae bacterium]
MLVFVVVVLILALGLVIPIGFRFIKKNKIRSLYTIPNFSYEYSLPSTINAQSAIPSAKIPCFTFSAPDHKIESGHFLVLKASYGGFSSYCSPVVKVSSPTLSTYHYLDPLPSQPSSQIWINLSSHAGTPLTKLSLHPQGVTLSATPPQLILFPQIDLAFHKILILAPHPDDAEIASFALYASYPHSTLIVTITDGANPTNPNYTPTPQRIIDSLSIPQFNGLPYTHTINLAYPDSQLNKLKQKKTSPPPLPTTDFVSLRALNASPLTPPAPPFPAWASLVSDLIFIIKKFSPSIIVTPHPLIDSHPDHLYTTLALYEALSTLDTFPHAILTTFVHNHITELFPFGPSHSEISLPPFPENLNQLTLFDSVQLVPASHEINQRKYRALEAHSDLRDIHSPLHPNLDSISSHLRIFVHHSFFYPHIPPVSLFRRFIRPHELFLTITSSATFQNICQHAKN